MDIERKIAKARVTLILSSPFFGSLCMRLPLKKENKLPTMATDGYSLYYNEEFVEKLSDEELEGVIAHEIMHCALLHPARLCERNPTKWNIAGDFAINHILKQAGFTLPKPHLDDQKYHDKTADEIYNLLPIKEVEITFTSCGEVLEPSGGKGKDGKGDKDESSPGQAMSPAERKQFEDDWKQAVAQAAHTAKMQGNLPADIARIVGDLLHPKINWKQQLQRFIKATAKNDYTWLRPNRRFVGQGMYFPGLRSNKIGEVVIGVDTSGSIGAEELNQFASEISSILQEASPQKIYVLYCDAEVSSVEEFLPQDLPLVLNPTGGGGTSFKPVFKWVDKQGITPECLIYLTDMYGDFPSRTPGYPVMWVTTSDKEDAPFGQVLKIEI